MTDPFSGPFDPGAGDGGAFFQDGWQRGFAGAFDPGSGVFGDEYSSICKGFGDGSGMWIKMHAGVAMAAGQFYYGPEAFQCPGVGNNTTALTRVDRLVLRNDQTAKTVRPFVIAGTAAVSPVPPAVTAMDCKIARITVPAGAGVSGNPVQSISAGMVADERDTFPLGVISVPNLAAAPPGRKGRIIAIDGDGVFDYYAWDGSEYSKLGDVDTGWFSVTAPAFAGGWGIADVGPPAQPIQLRARGPQVTMRGRAMPTTAAKPASTILTTIPAVFRPIGYVHRWISAEGGNLLNMAVSPTGVVSVEVVAAGTVPIGAGISLASQWRND